MEPSIWTRFAQFVKDSYTERLKTSGAGVFMGFIGANQLLFSGMLAPLVGVGWWVLKGVGTVILAFSTSMAASAGEHYFKKWTQKRDY
jgi:hypothetical protein